MKHIGFDVDSTTTHIGVFNDRGREVQHTKIATREANLVMFMMSIAEAKQVALEESRMPDFVTRVIEPHATKVGIRKHESHGTGRRGASRQGNRYLKTVLMTAAAAISSNRSPDNSLALMWHREVGRGVAPAAFPWQREEMRRETGVRDPEANTLCKLPEP